MDAAQTARVALAMLAADLRSACRLAADFEFVGLDREIDGMDADNLDFATHRWEPRRGGEGDTCEVSWFVDRVSPADVDGEDGGAVGGWGLFRRRDPTLDPEPFEGGSRELIAPGVARFELEFSDGFLWYESWGRDPWGPSREQRGDATSLLAGNLFGMPEAVRITLAFAPPHEGGPAQEGGERQGEPPVVLRSVVRLNLAGRVNDAYLSSASGGAGTSAEKGGGRGR
jgi:hypothetical protein